MAHTKASSMHGQPGRDACQSLPHPAAAWDPAGQQSSNLYMHCCCVQEHVSNVGLTRHGDQTPKRYTAEPLSLEGDGTPSVYPRPPISYASWRG